jgi:hypothetical protein
MFLKTAFPFLYTIAKGNIMAKKHISKSSKSESAFRGRGWIEDKKKASMIKKAGKSHARQEVRAIIEQIDASDWETAIDWQ